MIKQGGNEKVDVYYEQTLFMFILTTINFFIIGFAIKYLFIN
jgi:hypothetical protein